MQNTISNPAQGARLPATLRHACRAPTHLVMLAVLGSALAGCGALNRIDDMISNGSSGAPSAQRSAAIVKTPRSGQEFYKFKYGFVRFEAPDGPGGSALPVDLDPSRLLAALKELHGSGKPLGKKALFSEDELAELVPVLRDALAQAAQGQDVVFASTGKHGAVSLFETESVNTARVFTSQDTLQIIFGMTQINFGDQLRGEGSLKTFVVGSRDHALDTAAPVQGASWQPVSAQRSDWLSIPLAQLRADSLAVAGASAPPATTTMQAAERPDTVSATPAADGHPAASATPASTSAPRVGSEADPNEGERRLSTLERLRQKGLITRQEYEARRKAIVDGL